MNPSTQALRVLFAWRVVGLALFLGWGILQRLAATFMESGGNDLARTLLALDLGWAVWGAGLAGVLLWLATIEGGRARTVALLSVVSGVVALAVVVVEQSSISETGKTALSTLDEGAVLAVDLALWLALRKASTPSWLGPAFLATRLLVASQIAVLHVAILISAWAFLSSPAMVWTSTLAMGFHVGAEVLLLLLIWNAAAEPSSDKPTPRSLSATRAGDVAIGLSWLIGGLALTGASFAFASRAGGGRYLITTGPIVYGLIRLFRALSGEPAKVEHPPS
jgi:hypothetical protein